MSDGHTFLLALALMLILEGVLPFIAPNLWRETFRRITQMTTARSASSACRRCWSAYWCCSGREAEVAVNS